VQDSRSRRPHPSTLGHTLPLTGQTLKRQIRQIHTHSSSFDRGQGAAQASISPSASPSAEDATVSVGMTTNVQLLQ
jgi:hypothetical protein